jgi:hypothetical protein
MYRGARDFKGATVGAVYYALALFHCLLHWIEVTDNCPCSLPIYRLINNPLARLYALKDSAGLELAVSILGGGGA